MTPGWLNQCELNNSIEYLRHYNGSEFKLKFVLSKLTKNMSIQSMQRIN